MKSKGAIGGIIATVVSGVLVFYLTGGHKDTPTSQPIIVNVPSQQNRVDTVVMIQQAKTELNQIDWQAHPQPVNLQSPDALFNSVSGSWLCLMTGSAYQIAESDAGIALAEWSGGEISAYGYGTRTSTVTSQSGSVVNVTFQSTLTGMYGAARLVPNNGTMTLVVYDLTGQPASTCELVRQENGGE